MNKYWSISCKDLTEKSKVILILLNYFNWRSGSTELIPHTLTKFEFNSCFHIIIEKTIGNRICFFQLYSLTNTAYSDVTFTNISVEDILTEYFIEIIK